VTGPTGPTGSSGVISVTGPILNGGTSTAASLSLATTLPLVTSVNGTTIPASATLTKTSDNLSVFAATTSAQLAGVLSDETGYTTGAKAVFSAAPTLTGLTTVGDLTTSSGGTVSAKFINAPTTASTGDISINPYNGTAYGDVSIGGGPDGGTATLKNFRISDYNSGFNTSFSLSLTANRSITIQDDSGTLALTKNVHYIGTTSVALNRASANLALTGITSVAFPGATSGTSTLQAPAVAGTATITLPSVTGTLALLDSPTFTGTATFPLNGTSGLSGITIGTKKLFVSSTTPTGMVAGDIWIQV
jgi:hypothetical protein